MDRSQRQKSQPSHDGVVHLPRGITGSHYARNEPHWANLTTLELVKRAIGPLREYIDDPEVDGVSWSNPFVESQYPVEWDWSDKGAVSGTFTEEDVHAQEAVTARVDEVLNSHDDLAIFRIRTERTAIIKRNNAYIPLASKGRIPELRDLPHKDREARLAEIFRPYSIADIGDSPLKIPFRVEAGEKGVQGAVAVQFLPLMIDEDESRAYYPVMIGLVLDPAAPESPSTWSPKDQEKFWNGLKANLTPGAGGLMGVVGIGAVAGGVLGMIREAVLSRKPAPQALSMPRIVPPRRSVMNPVPVPREATSMALGMALTRGLGQMFASYSRVPNLDIRGEIAIQEAQARFWALLEGHLNQAVSRHPHARWEIQKEGERTICILHGIDPQEAQEIWSKATGSMNKGEGGPGLEVATPNFENRSRFDHIQGKVLAQTHIVLWPDAALRDRDGYGVPPVRFRTEGSPGYLELLERHGPRPYFADGWLWIPRGNEREGFRIGGLPRLLFPEGRAALERVQQEKRADYDGELNRIYRNPSLFRHEEERAIQDLRTAIRRVDAWLRQLSLYDIGHDLILCIFEAFYRQRNLWIDEKVALPDGREIATRPWRVIRLDPEELYLRLDPRQGWGDNWRNRLFEKLEALTTFERQTRVRTGRKVDVGDRLLGRVIDGFRGIDEGTAPETDVGLGLTRMLRQAQAMPVNAFFAEVSVDFMSRLVTWAVDEHGVVQWGLDAASAAQRAHLVTRPEEKKEARQLGEAKRQEARSKPYYDHSPRLLTVWNLEEWPRTRKYLAGALLQETTPNFDRYKDARGRNRRRNKPNRLGGKHKLVAIGGDDYIACNGSQDHGYRARIWIEKAGYEKRRGPGGGTRAYQEFVEDLKGLVDSLGLQLRTKNRQKDTAEVLKAMEGFKENPAAGYDIVLLAFLPADLEKRLRERLAEAGIDAVDEDEFLPPLLRKDHPDGLSPMELRTARKQAGWTQAQLAEKIGVSRPNIAYWESARKPIPAERMALLLEVLKPYLDRPES